MEQATHLSPIAREMRNLKRTARHIQAEADETARQVQTAKDKADAAMKMAARLGLVVDSQSEFRP